MKLQTKLTALFSALLLLVAGALLLALHAIAGRAAATTAEATLKDAVTSYAGEIEYESGMLRDFRVRHYDDGAYLLTFSADGGELLTGTDIFDIEDIMPDLLENHEPGQVFRALTEEAGVYCYFVWKPASADGRGRMARADRRGRGERVLKRIDDEKLMNDRDL